jgi:hypothetical protein
VLPHVELFNVTSNFFLFDRYPPKHFIAILEAFAKDSLRLEIRMELLC